MAKTKEEIIAEFESLFRKTCWGKFYSDYYVGITNNEERRLYNEHNVIPYECHWCIDAGDKELACEVEHHFIRQGMKGHEGGGAKDSTIIYVYRITPRTLEAPIFTDFEEVLSEAKKEPPKVEVYSGQAEMYRFWKIRTIGKEQHTKTYYYEDKVMATTIAEGMAKEIQGELIVAKPEGAITIKK